MYEAITYRDIVKTVAAVRQELPGYHGPIPLRISKRPQLLHADVDAAEVRSGATCATCARRFAENDRKTRVRNGPWIHSRCRPAGGEAANYLPVQTLNDWLRAAGATFAGWAITEGVDIEFVVDDLPGNLAAMFPHTRDRTAGLVGPNGSPIRPTA